MTNFNGINPWLNALNYLNNLRQNQTGNNIQPQGANPAPQQNALPPQVMPNLSTNAFVKTPSDFLINQSEQAVLAENLKMENEVIQKYLQSLLDMPESLDKFLKLANPKELDKTSQFLKLFLENMVNNKELSNLLKQNSNDAIQKLLNVITQSLKNGADVPQLKEILAVLNSLHTSATVSQNSLRELFLLYIPINFQVFKEESNFEKIKADSEEKIKENALSILFETISFSNILALLNDENGIVTLEIHANSDFPFDRFKKIISIEAKEHSLNIACDYLKIKEYGTKGQKQNFKIISDDFVSVNVLSVSNLAIKAIFKIDKDLAQNKP